jgi:hypothetical protein
MADKKKQPDASPNVFYALAHDLEEAVKAYIEEHAPPQIREAHEIAAQLRSWGLRLEGDPDEQTGSEAVAALSAAILKLAGYGFETSVQLPHGRGRSPVVSEGNRR